MKPIGKLNWKRTSVSIDRYMNASIEAPHRITLSIPYTVFPVYPAPTVKVINDRLLKKIRTLLRMENHLLIGRNDEIWAWYDMVIYRIWAKMSTPQNNGNCSVKNAKETNMDKNQPIGILHWKDRSNIIYDPIFKNVVIVVPFDLTGYDCNNLYEDFLPNTKKFIAERIKLAMVTKLGKIGFIQPREYTAKLEITVPVYEKNVVPHEPLHAVYTVKVDPLEVDDYATRIQVWLSKTK